MDGRSLVPKSEGKHADMRSRSPGPNEFPQDEHSQRPPSYDDATTEMAEPVFAETTTTTVTTTTQTVQTTTQTVQTTTHFFSLPLWRRRAPVMATSMTEDPRMSQAYTTEDGHMLHASSYNVDKELPAVPNNQQVTARPFTRRSVSSQNIHVGGQNGTTNGESSRSRKTRAATMYLQELPSQSSTHTLAQAGLGIGLPPAMPLAAARSASASRPASPARSRPKTAPRLEPRNNDIKEVRRIRSFKTLLRSSTNIQDEELIRKSNENSLPQRMGPEVIPVNEIDNRQVPSPQEVGPQPGTLTKRTSFWNRRRVQSLRGGPPMPLGDLSQRTEQSLVPALPTLLPMSPMFPDQNMQSSPGLMPQSADTPPQGRLRRRHSERSSASASPRNFGFESGSALEPPPIPKRSPNRPPPPGTSSPRASTSTDYGSHSSSRSQGQRGATISFISSPAIQRFPLVDERMSRPRAMTNPNILHRLSLGIFPLTSPPSPISSPSVSTNIANDTSLTSSPRQSETLTRKSLSKTVEIPKPKADDESPDVFLVRLEEAVSKAEIANILAKNGDPFYMKALQAYIDRFNFKNDALDIALRKLLMDVGLPKETQQIDRVMEAFASRYTKCNPGLFVAEDHAYILSFSLIMLHTDAFNKSNKRKMTKMDYVKNTKLVGIPTEVLDYFYDNIVFAPFVFIEDPLDINGQRGLVQEGRIRSATSGHVTPNSGGSALSVLGRSNRIDPYYLISQNLLNALRVNLESHIPPRNPFSYQGTAGSWNESELRKSFARADTINFDSTEARRLSMMPLFSMNAGGAPGPILGGLASNPMAIESPTPTSLSNLRVTKVGVLNRKDDLLEGGKRAASRKWREWSLILTGSQLLFYRDSSVALALLSHTQSGVETDLITSQLAFLKPEETISVKGAIAVFDSSYTKHQHVLRLALSSGRQFLLQAENEVQRNEWIAHINYASTFKTAGIRMRRSSTAESVSFSPRQVAREEMSIQRNRNEQLLSSAKLVAPDGESSTLQSRSQIVLSKISEIDSKIKTTREQLNSEIRVVRNIAVLTPFQRSTRDRLQNSVIGLARRIKQLRLEIVQLTCYRDVLAADLASEERCQRRSRRSLQLEGQQTNKSGKNSPVPRMTLSVYGDDSAIELSRRSSSRSDISHGNAESSICESFHSALDFSADWPVSSRSLEARTTNSFEVSSPIPLSADSEPGESGLFSPSTTSGVDLSSSSTLPVSEVSQSEDEKGPKNVSLESRDLAEDCAEEWDKTRAARRVSLVRLPPTFPDR